ncbi:MAG: alginate lyase family protein [Bacteroidaceae bacterium]|nr:alginate lyase family protein [Bacteroidaceae bacterium]
MRYLVLSLLLLHFPLCTFSQPLRHPGIIISRESLDRMKGYVTNRTEPVFSAYQALAEDERAQLSYQPHGPYPIVARDGKHARTKGGSEKDFTAAFYHALLHGITSDDAHARKAMAIINAYADSLRSLDGHDAPLCCLQGFYLVNAMELLRSKASDAEKGKWKDMLVNVFLKTIDKFEDDSPYANGNWGAAVNKMRMAIAVFTDDRALYEKAKLMFLNCNDNSSLPNYVSETGQCQETGRDQAHAQLGVGNMAEICEIAWNQGDDLWGAYDNRMLKAYEYMAKYNLGYDDIPFSTWSDCTGLYCNWTVPSAQQRGVFRPIYELAYAHFVGRQHLSMPFTSMVLGKAGKARPEKKTGNCDAISPASLLFFNETKVDMRTSRPKVRSLESKSEVYTYDAPDGAPMKDDYEVLVQARGSKDWNHVDTYMAKVNAALADGQHKVSQISYAVFDFSGSVNVKVISKKRKYKTAKIRPTYRGVIANVLNDSVLTFSLFQPENISVEFDGSISDNLLVFTGKPAARADVVRKEAQSNKRRFVVVPDGYYDRGDGLRYIQNLMPESKSMKVNAVDVTGSSAPVAKDIIRIPSNTTVYLSPGAYINGTFAIEDASDVSIIGRGICRPDDGYEGAHVHRSRNVLIDGLVLCTCPIGESSNVMLHDVRSISHPGWGDGLNVFGGSSDITFDRVFCRNSDDCTTAYATRKGFKGSVSNIRMTNSTLWADVAHPIFIGLHGAGSLVEKGVPADSIVGLVYENIDILGQEEPQLDYQGCLAINVGDNNLVRDVLFENIRIEDIRHGSILQVKVSNNAKYCTAVGRGVRDVSFNNIRYNGREPGMSLILGYDSLHNVSNVVFRNLRLNGRVIHDAMPGKPGWYKTADMGGIFLNDHVEGIRFEK